MMTITTATIHQTLMTLTMVVNVNSSIFDIARRFFIPQYNNYSNLQYHCKLGSYT